MKAAELMTKEVVSVSPDMPVREIARLLLSHQVSAAPVVDQSGSVIGMVSEGDLLSPNNGEHAVRRERWLARLAEGEPLSPEFLASLPQPGRTARNVMSSPVIEVTDETDAGEIADLLVQFRIKRVPVTRDGRLVGIISRVDLLRAMAEREKPHSSAPAHGSVIAEAIARLDHRFSGRNGDKSASAGRKPATATAEGGLSVADFHKLMADFARHQAEATEAARRAEAAHRRERVKQLVAEHVRDERWNALLHGAREAAERGEEEFLLLRFPSDLCIDQGRAINASLPDWPKTLRGEAAEIYLHWERELKPRGFHLMARVLDYPNGMPGDIGLFLGWTG